MALNFDGVDDYCTFTSAASVNNLGPLTWMAWVLPDLFTAAFGRMWVKGSGTGSARFISLLRSTTSFGLAVDFSTTTLTRQAALNLVRLGQWDHWTLTWDGTTTATGASIYRNAIESATYTATTNGAGTVTDASFVGGMGARPSDASGDFDGKMAHMQMWNRVLSTDELRQAMLLPGSVQPGLVQYYPMDYLGPNNRQLHDFSGFANHGTSNGVTVFTTSQPQTTQVAVVPMGGGGCSY